MRSRSRAAAVALLVVAVFVISEQDARADGGNQFTIPFYWIIGGSAAGAASVPFLVADVAYTVQRRWLPPGWAIPQIVIGGGVNAAVAVWGVAIYSGKDCVGGYTSAAVASGAPPPAPQSQPNACSGILPLPIGTAILSVGFIAHGVASLVLNDPPSATQASNGVGLKTRTAYLRWVPDIFVTRDGNAIVALSGGF